MSGARVSMTDELYEYLDSVSDREPAVLAELREETQKDPRKNMQIHPMQGQFMAVLVEALAPKKIVEVGTYTGYSSLSMALALPEDAKIWCFDVSEEWTSLARKYWSRAGVDDRVELRLAPGAESLQALLDEGHGGSVDLIFLDADKPNYHVYWELALDLLRPGGLIIVDNTLFQELAPEDVSDDDIRKKFDFYGDDIIEILIESTHAIRAFNRQIHKDDRVSLAMIPVGDGMTFAVKR